MSLKDFLGVTNKEIRWSYLLNFVLAAFLVSALSILFKKNINAIETFIVALINGILMLGGIILAIRYLKIQNVILTSLTIGFICSLLTLLYLDFNYISYSALNFLVHVTGHFITFLFLHFFLMRFNYIISSFLCYLSKGIVLGLLRFIITGNDGYIEPRLFIQIFLYALAVSLFIFIGAQILKLKY